MSKAFELKNHYRCQLEALEARCLLTVDFVDSGQELGNGPTTSVAMGDIDGDGTTDVVTGGDSRFIEHERWTPGPGDVDTRVPSIWLNNGNAILRSSPDAFRVFPNDVALADLNGDGTLDVLGVGRDAKILGLAGAGRVWLNDGTGRLTTVPMALGALASQIALGDLDNDGDIDAFMTEGFSPNTVWFNDGHGQFQRRGQGLGLADSRDIALGDLDGDGDLDAIVANGWRHQSVVWLNNGDGRFTEGAKIGNGVAFAVALGDLDNDGDLDAMVGNNAIYLNDGDGNFESTLQELGEGDARSVALGDIDNDGDLDAVTSNDVAHRATRVWLNDGLGFFEGTDIDLGEGGSIAVALGDLDDDGDLDIYIGHDGPDKIWLNQLITTARLPGDANGDGVFNRDDIVQVLQAGKFMTDEPANWEEGDWNRDGIFDQNDLVAALQAGPFTRRS